MKGNRLVISLKFADQNADAEKARKKVRTLGRKIDDLLAKAMDEWSINAKTLIAEMRKSNQSLQGDIRDIRKKKNLAQKTIKALGLLDDVISVATDLLAKI